MKVSELYRQTAELGFESSLESDDRFYYAANRALMQVSAIKPAIGSYVIDQHSIQNLVQEDTFSPVMKYDCLSYSANDAKAFYFEADGNGIANIERQNGEGEWAIITSVSLTSDKQFASYRGLIRDGASFVSGAVRIRFTGEYLYAVKNVAMYGHLYSDRAEDVPAFKPYVRYHMPSLADDFLSFGTPPVLDDGTHERLSAGYVIERGQDILLPYSFCGCIKVFYKRKPHEMENIGNACDDAADIDLDPDLCAILPILVAAYVWVEDEPQMAEYYMSLYRERVMDMERSKRDIDPVVMRNTSGW